MLGKRVLILSVASTILFGASAFAATKTGDVVASVNGEKITKEALSKSLTEWYSPAGTQDLIMIRLVDQEAKKAGVVVTASEVKARLDSITKQMPLPQGMTFDDYIRQGGRTPAYALAMVRVNVQAEKILKKNIKITPVELAQYRKARHILIMTGAQDPKDQEAKDKDAKAKIEQIASEIKDKKITFEAAATKYSEDPGSKEKGGDLGWFSKGKMVPQFETAVFSAKLGEVSAPIKSPFGYHLILVTGTGDASTGADREELKNMLITQGTDTRAVQAWIMGIKDKAKIVNTMGPKNVPQARPMIQPASRAKLTPLGVQKVTVPAPKPAAAPTPAATPAPAGK